MKLGLVNLLFLLPCFFVMLPRAVRAFRVSNSRIHRQWLYPTQRYLGSGDYDKSNKEKKFVEVEFIDNTKHKKKNSDLHRDDTLNNENPENSSSSLFGMVQNTAKSAVEGITKFFGRDEESLRRKEQAAKMNAEIDRAFAHSGILGGVLKSVVKMVGGRMMNSMADTARDMETIRTQVEGLIQSNLECQKHLGSPVRTYPATNFSSSTVDINGKTENKIVLVLPAQGTKATGRVEVTASMQNGKTIIMDSARLVLSSGQEIDLTTTSGRKRGTGTIIDV